MGIVCGEAGAAKFQPGYWDRDFGVTSHARTISISLQVDSVAKGEAAADGLLTAQGAKRTGNQQYYSSDEARPAAQFTYEMPLGKCEMAGQKLIDLGILRSYNSQKSDVAAILSEVKERLAAIESEVKENSRHLQGMPIAEFFLTQKQERLLRSKAAAENAATKCQISVHLAAEAPKTDGKRD